MANNKPFSVLLIPDSGDSRRRVGFASGVFAKSTGKSEARVIFRQNPDVQFVEVVVLKHREMQSDLSGLIRRNQ